MSPAASPCPDADPAGTPATPTAESQLAGIRELVRIAELQARAYAEDAAAEPAEADAAPADPETAGSSPQAPAVPRQAAASDSESSAVTKPA
jgi:hypothetical protein